MKKKIFTLICLSFLLSGTAFTAMAQTAVFERNYIGQGVPPIDGRQTGFEDFYYPLTSPLYSNCNYTVKLKAGNDATNFVLSLWGSYIDENGATHRDSLTSYLSVPAIPKVAAKDSINVTYYIKDLPAKYTGIEVLAHKDKIPVGGSGAVGSIGVTRYFNYPQITVKYEAPTPDYDGSAELSIVGGSSQLQYLLGNGKWEYVYTAGLQGETWNPNADSIVPFTATQISNFPDVIYFKEPNTSTYREIRIRGEEYPVVPITPRLVTIPTVSGATLLPSGKVYVESGKDLELTITVDDVKKEPKLTADQGWEVEREYLGGNVYKYTIKRVTKATNIHVELVPAGISDVEGSSVWSAGGQIYVTAATAASAQIYGATGAVIKQVSLGAGETTSVSLPAGFYIVTLNGNAYKVILK